MFRFGKIAAALLLAGFGVQEARANNIEIPLLRATGLPATCAVGAFAQIRVKNLPKVGNYADSMKVQVMRFAPRTKLNVFVTQVPNPPFGVSFYVGQIETNDIGSTHRYFTSRFNNQLFVIAPGTAPAPTPHGTKDANTNPTFKPIHTYHVGLWFATAEDARKNGTSCPTGPTDFGPGHVAGGQVFSSRNATNTNDLDGILGKIFY